MGSSGGGTQGTLLGWMGHAAGILGARSGDGQETTREKKRKKEKNKERANKNKREKTANRKKAGFRPYWGKMNTILTSVPQKSIPITLVIH